MDEYTLTGQRPSVQGTGEAIRVKQPVDAERVREMMRVLKDYQAAKAKTDDRVIAAEHWWKMHNSYEEIGETSALKDGGYVAKTAWLHSLISNKHADYMDNYGEATILPREPGDVDEARKLTGVVPYVFKQADFRTAWSRVGWQKFKYGTGVYKTYWDKTRLNGLGEIAIERISVLNLYWQPQIENIQDSEYVFQLTPMSRKRLIEDYPQLEGHLQSNGGLTVRKYGNPDEHYREGETSIFVECYYKQEGVLHYCTFVSGYDEPLFASENEPESYPNGFYDHGLYPYDIDVLFPVEGTLAGYGYVDIEANPQIAIDLLRTAITENAIAGSTPRYFVRSQTNINQDDYLNLNKKLVAVPDLSDNALKLIEHKSLDSVYVSVLEELITELRETSGNTETSAGTTHGVTSATGIAALQEASGKSSRDAIGESYNVLESITYKVIELIRQFWDMPRTIRVTGDNGRMEFTQYSNAGLQPQPLTAGGYELGYRQPMFDIDVRAQKLNAYTSSAYNDFALQLFQLGFFNPQLSDQSLIALQMMDFQGKEKVTQLIQESGTLQSKLVMLAQYAMQLAQESGNAQAVAQIQTMLASFTGTEPTPAAVSAVDSSEDNANKGETGGETRANEARANAASAAQVRE